MEANDPRVDGLVNDLAAVLGREVTSADLDLTVDAFVPDGAGRTAFVTMLVGVGAPQVVDYVVKDTTVREALQWAIATGESADPRSIGPNRAAAVRLRPVVEQDLPALYRAATDPRAAYRWRFRGATPSPEEFWRSLWSGTFAQFIVEGTVDREAYGLVTSYNGQPDLGHAYIAMYRSSERRPRGEMMRGMFLFINHLFSSFALRKLYAEVPGYNEGSLGIAGLPAARLEGTLTEHDYHDGVWWDHHIYAIRRGDWMDFVKAMAPFIPSEAVQDGSVT